MKATSISISLVGPCNAHCPFCISPMTWKTGVDNNRLLRRHLSRALDFARYHGVDTVLITGSGEPTIHRDLVFHIIAEARAAGIPIVELQTNGKLIANDPAYLDELVHLQLATVALSVSSVNPARSAQIMEIGLDYLDLVRTIASRGLICRVTLNLLKHDREELLEDLPKYADTLYETGARQLTLRRLGVPDVPEQTEEAKKTIKWIRKNALGEKEIKVLEKEVKTNGTLLRTLSYGAEVYNYRNLSVTVGTCMTDTAETDEIRSFILMPDGHVYHSWNYPGSILL